MKGASNFVLLDRPGQGEADQAWYLPTTAAVANLTAPATRRNPVVVYSRSEAPAYETLAGLAESGEFDYALLSSSATTSTGSGDDDDDGIETLYEAREFAGFDWRAVVRRGRVGELVRTRPAIRVVKFGRSHGRD